MSQLKKPFLLLFFGLYLFPFLTKAQDIIIKNGSDWHYYDAGYLNEDWMLLNNFSDWKIGASPIGYGDSKVTTEIGFGGNTEKKHITKYFKKRIQLNREKYSAYEFKILKDDGIVLYINGKEIFRDNMPNIAITGKTLATEVMSGNEENEFSSFIFDNTIISKNEIVISISVHQAYESSSDCVLDLELLGHDNPEILAVLVDSKNKLNSDLLNKIENLNSKFEYEKVVLHNDDLNGQNYNLKTTLYIISVLVILFTIGCITVISELRKKLKKSDKWNQNISDEIIQKEKEMITLATNLLHNKQYFKEIKADLKGIKTEDATTVKSILKLIDTILDRDDDWETLKKHFNAVNSGFYERLIRLHPSLSETELRHCIFIKLHLHTKEIARILLIDPRSVQTVRYRIKKKMNLSEEETVRNYLLNLE
ncbi:hypothetical protein [uncultured Polaribacter sp.]|uniref:helix-turn-helix transcriptional regulator n=1 Tax=uncultured Polaribacter sp. TaxID=174711 RepID=UPI0026340ADF|nr:hypothetical protein [uncultured Polaribacter sp.]